MNMRTTISRTIRSLREGPRPLPGGLTQALHIAPDQDVLRSLSTGSPIAVGDRVRVSPASEPPLWVARLGPATILPRLGTVIAQNGAVVHSTIHEAVQYDPKLTSFAYLRRRDGELEIRPPNKSSVIRRAAVWLPFHATYNFGHFILDGLTSLLALEEAALLGDFAAVAPPLKAWQRELLDIAFPDLNITTVSDHVVQAEEVAFASSMNNFLHAPTSIVGRLRDRVLANHRPAGTAPSRRIYLSRRGWSMRVMLNEHELEAELARRGFAIVHPEALTVSEQIEMMRDAEIVIGPSGAALANALWAPPHSRLIEIRPMEFGDAWVPLFREALGSDCQRFHVPDEVPRREVPFRYRRRLGFRFAYRVDIDALLKVVDAQQPQAN